MEGGDQQHNSPIRKKYNSKQIYIAEMSHCLTDLICHMFLYSAPHAMIGCFDFFHDALTFLKSTVRLAGFCFDFKSAVVTKM